MTLDPLSQQIYDLAIKPNRTQEDDKRLKQLQDQRNGLVSQAQAQAQTQEENIIPKTRFIKAPESDRILKFINATKEVTSDRYKNYMPQFKKINERYNAVESRY